MCLGHGKINNCDRLCSDDIECISDHKTADLIFD